MTLRESMYHLSRREHIAMSLMTAMIGEVKDSYEKSEDGWGDYFCERAHLAVEAADHLIYQLDKQEEEP